MRNKILKMKHNLDNLQLATMTSSRRWKTMEVNQCRQKLPPQLLIKTKALKKNGRLLGTPVTGLTGGLCWGVCCYAPGYSFRIKAVDPEDF